MRFASAVLVAVAVVGSTIACGGDDGPAESVDVTPVGTKDATPTPAAIDPGGGAPPPVEPELDEELTEVTRGDLEAAIEPGASLWRPWCRRA